MYLLIVVEQRVTTMCKCVRGATQLSLVDFQIIFELSFTLLAKSEKHV